jgi:type II secretory pathway component PulF
LALHNSNIGFTRQELAILQAAEKSNQMRVAVPALVDALEIQNNGRRQLMSKLTMPLVSGFMLIVLSLGVLIFMLPMVLGPTLERKPEALQSFPFIIRWYWYASLWLKEYWYIPTAILVGIALFILLRNLPFIKPYFQRLLMWFGPTRKLQLAFNSTLVVFFMPALIRSGMTTPQVINTLADCVQNMSIAGLLRAAARDHEAGMKMGQALTILPFKASFTNAVSAGEATGQLAERVQDLQTPYRIELERNIRQTVSTLNFIVMALLLPMFLMSTYTSLVAPIFALMKF